MTRQANDRVPGRMSVAGGAALAVAMRWSDRLVGLASTLVLARLLIPEDFGIVAMASIVVGLIDVLLDMGVAITLIRNRDARQRDYDAAWTLRLLQSAVAAIALFLLAEPAAAYFRDARVAPVLQLLALSPLLAACENIGIVSFQKEMRFGMDFRFFVGKRITGCMLALSAAWILQSYWALVIGTLGGRLAGVALSYAMHPMRPRFDLAGVPAILSFSTWNLVRGIGNYLNEHAHRLVVGRRASTVVMGEYTVASEIAALPSTELLAPLNRVMLPAFVEAKEDPERLREVFLLALGVQALIGIPAGAGMALVARDAVLTLLGERWLAAVPFVQVIGFNNVVAALCTSGGYLMLALGRARVTAANTWLQVALFVAAAVWLLPQEGPLAIAALRLATAACGLAVFLFLIRGALPGFSLAMFAAVVWRPCLAAGAMGLLLAWLPLPPLLPAPLRLLLATAAGASAYAAALLLLWLAAGRPAGAESWLLRKLRLFPRPGARPA